MFGSNSSFLFIIFCPANILNTSGVVLLEWFSSVSLITGRLFFCFMGIITDLITRAWTSVGSYKSHLSRLPIPTGGNDCYPLRKFPWRLTRHFKLLRSSWKKKKKKKVGLRKRNNVLIQVWHTWSKMLTILKSSEWEVGEGGDIVLQMIFTPIQQFRTKRVLDRRLFY